MESAFRPEEWSQHTDALRRMARELLREEHQSEDLVQSAYLTALERPPRVLTRAWLAKVLRRRGLDSLRRKERRRTSEALEGPDHAPDTAELALLLERHEAVVSALRSLKEPYAQTLYMRYFDGLAPSEIAQRLDVPVKTVKTRLHRGLQQMRVRLENRYGPEAGGLHAALAPFVLGQWTAATTLAPIALVPAVTGGVGIMVKKIAIVAVVLVLGAWGVRYVRLDAKQPVLPVAGATEASSEADAIKVQQPETLASPGAQDGREPAAE